MKNQGIRFITLTAVFLALLIVFQSLSASLGQLVTGSLVNFVLVAACLIAGWKSAAVVAILSPFFAKLFGIGPIYPILPVVALGNLSLVAVYALVAKIKINGNLQFAISVPAAAIVKYLVLSTGVVKVVLPPINLAEKAAAKMTVMFGTTQLITALIGGAIAALTIPLIKRGIEKSKTGADA